MTRYGEDFKLSDNLMGNIASYMDDEIREDLHAAMAPCEPEGFLEEYIKRDPGFKGLLGNEFGIVG